MTKSLKITILFISIALLQWNNSYAQQVIQSGDFTYIPTLNNEAVLITEIPLKDSSVAAQNYSKLKNWIKNNYTTDLINSSIIYYQNDDAVAVKSKVELLLPLLNDMNVSEKSVLTYQLYAFIDNDKCVFQISNMEYKVVNAIPAIKQKISAENFVSDNALKQNDVYNKERIETKKSTLFYFNKLVDSLDNTLNP